MRYRLFYIVSRSLEYRLQFHVFYDMLPAPCSLRYAHGPYRGAIAFNAALANYRHQEFRNQPPNLRLLPDAPCAMPYAPAIYPLTSKTISCY